MHKQCDIKVTLKEIDVLNMEVKLNAKSMKVVTSYYMKIQNILT